MIPPLLFTSFLATYVAAETMTLNVERLIIKDPQLPSNFNNLRICFISDIHHGRYSSPKRLRKMVKKIAQLEPDLILLGGDYLQTPKSKKDRVKQAWQELLKILKDLPPTRYGNFAVMGNHDHVFTVDFIRQSLAKINIKLLNNEGLFLHNEKQKIYLGGVGDLWHDGADLAKTMANSDQQNNFNLILSHQPNFIDQLRVEDGINFVLAGHTHGAQCRMFNYMPYMPKGIAHWEYTVGLIETPQTRMLVSPGVGNVAPYFRFFSTPKIHLLKFKSAPHLSTLSARL